MITAAELLQRLNQDPEAVWTERWAAGLTPRVLERVLGKFGISSRNCRCPGGDQAKSYFRTDFGARSIATYPHAPKTRSQPSQRSHA